MADIHRPQSDTAIPTLAEAVWFRGILLFRPDPSLMARAPLPFQLHTLAALGLLAIWPFTRLVHAWAVRIRNPVAPPRSSPGSAF